MILKNQSLSYGIGVAFDGNSNKPIGTSHEFGGLDDRSAPSTKVDLMSAYLDFFGLTATLEAQFYAGTTGISEGESVEFTDISIGGIISWEWTLEGGSPPSSSIQNPVVEYFNPGLYDVTLTVSDGVEFNTTTIEDYITVVSAPQIPGTQPEMNRFAQISL